LTLYSQASRYYQSHISLRNPGVRGYTEWNDFECKKARASASEDAYRTVSAFSNTPGGTLVFGVTETDNAFKIVGVEQPDKLQNDFLSTLRDGQKLNLDLHVTEAQLLIDGKLVLAFFISETSRVNKPVYPFQFKKSEGYFLGMGIIISLICLKRGFLKVTSYPKLG
jgi:predicted HTH transcriptional regulator